MVKPFQGSLRRPIEQWYLCAYLIHIMFILEYWKLGFQPLRGPRRRGDVKSPAVRLDLMSRRVLNENQSVENEVPYLYFYCQRKILTGKIYWWRKRFARFLSKFLTSSLPKYHFPHYQNLEQSHDFWIHRFWIFGQRYFGRFQSELTSWPCQYPSTFENRLDAEIRGSNHNKTFRRQNRSSAQDNLNAKNASWVQEKYNFLKTTDLLFANRHRFWKCFH